MGRLLLLVSLLYSISFSIERTEEMGGAPAAIMRSGFGARAQGLGNAFVAVFGPGINPYWNTGAITFQKNSGLESGGSLLSLGRREGYVSYHRSIKPRGAFGLSWLYRGDPDIELIDAKENTVGTTSDAFNILHIGIGYRLLRKVGVGLSINMFNHKLYKYKSSGTGIIDISIASVLNNNWSFGANIKNLTFISGAIPWQVETGTELNYVPKFSFPYELKLGTSYKNKWWNKPFLISIEENFFVWKEEKDSSDPDNYVQSRYWSHTEHAGFEWWLYPIFALRSGYDNGRFPIGIAVKNIIANGEIDYSFCIERNGMGFNHNIELIWQF